MKSISQQLQDDIRKILEAKKPLHPNQQKIDVHEPEKDEITAHDFKKLRADKAAKPMKEEEEVEQIVELSGKAAQQAAVAISLIKAGKKKGTMPKPMEEEDKKKIVSPFDYKNYTSQIPKKPGELTGHDSKKISTGTVYTKKPVKEAMSHQAATTMKHIPNPSPALKKAAKDIKPGIAGYRDRIAMLKAGGVKEDVEQQDEAMEKKTDFMDRQKRLAAAGAETAKDPARLTRMSGIPGYTAAMDLAKKTTTKEALELDETKGAPKGFHFTSDGKLKRGDADRDGSGGPMLRTDPLDKLRNKIPKVSEEHDVEELEYTFADYLNAARAQYNDEDAVLVANEAFKNQDITLFVDQSQSPEA